MSEDILGLPYSTLKAIIYPRPPYKTFTLLKRNGSPRIIHEPRKRLKVIQDRFLRFLYEHAGPTKACVHGFTLDRSIVTNARMHCSDKTQFLLNIDIEDFFPSITFYRVRGVLRKQPFMCSYEVATALAQLCTFEGRLPQGAPTSPLLANLVCRSLDHELMVLAKRHRATYTRYADDITFSFSVRHPEKLPSNMCSCEGGIVNIGHELQAIFQNHTFRINPSKSRISHRPHRLEVTGITINEFPNVKRGFIDRIRGALHAWEIYGYEKAQSEWENRLRIGHNKDVTRETLKKRQTRGEYTPELRNVIWGKLLYVRMVRGHNDALYSRLAHKYNDLCGRDNNAGKFISSRLPVDFVVRNSIQAKKAIFVIEWEGLYNGETVGARGTAFAYKDLGLITCEHVIKHGDHGPYADELEEYEIFVRNAETDQTWKAAVVKRDKHRDLAVLQFDTSDPPTRWHFDGLKDPMKLNEEGVLIGFPNPTRGRPANQVTAQIVNVFPRAGLKRFEIKERIRQGNSGGPFVDQNYRVGGVAQQGAEQGRGNDECLSIEEVDEWLGSQ